METLIKRSFELESELLKFFQFEIFDESPRYVSAHVMCSIAFEHAEAAKILISTNKLTSAMGLLRLQFEALVRGMWCLYSASDIAIEKLFTLMNPENFNRLNKMPMLSDMLKQLEGKAPDQAVSMLQEFKECSWKPLSSYVHGGVMALQTHAIAFPPDLLRNVVKASNGVSTMAAMLLVILTGDSAHRGRITKLQKQFSDCLPDLLPA